MENLDLSNLSNLEIKNELEKMYYLGWDGDIGVKVSDDVLELLCKYGYVLDNIEFISELFMNDNISKNDKFRILSNLDLGLLNERYDIEYDENEYGDYENFGNYLSNCWISWINE